MAKLHFSSPLNSGMTTWIPLADIRWMEAFQSQCTYHHVPSPLLQWPWKHWLRWTLHPLETLNDQGEPNPCQSILDLQHRQEIDWLKPLMFEICCWCFALLHFVSFCLLPQCNLVYPDWLKAWVYADITWSVVSFFSYSCVEQLKNRHRQQIVNSSGMGVLLGGCNKST